MRRFLLIVLVALFPVARSSAQTSAPHFESQTRFQGSSTDYEAFVNSAKERFPGPFDEVGFRRDHGSDDWRLLQQHRKIEARTFSYRVDGLLITGALVRPRRGAQHPILIWARGGVGEARLDEPQMVEMAWWAERGYAVFASNYRGAGGSEGHDECEAACGSHDGETRKMRSSALPEVGRHSRESPVARHRAGHDGWVRRNRQ